MPTDFFGHVAYGPGEDVFILDLRLQVIPARVTDVSCGSSLRRGCEYPEVNISYVVEPRMVLPEPMRLHGRLTSDLVFASEADAVAEREVIRRARFGGAAGFTPGTTIVTTP